MREVYRKTKSFLLESIGPELGFQGVMCANYRHLSIDGDDVSKKSLFSSNFTSYDGLKFFGTRTPHISSERGWGYKNSSPLGRLSSRCYFCISVTSCHTNIQFIAHLKVPPL